jgi:hypothetical protein
MKYDYEKVREMGEAKRKAKQKKDMKNKRGNGSSTSKSNIKATNKPSSESNVPSAAKRKAKQEKDKRDMRKAMENKRGDSSSKSKSNTKAVKGKSRKESISTPATRKAKQKKDMKNIRGPGAVDKSSPTQIQRKAVTKKTPLLTAATPTPAIKKEKTPTPAIKKEKTPTPEKETSWLGSLFGGDSSEKDEKRWKSSKSPRARRSIARGATNAGYAKGGMVKPRGWGKARHPKCK